MATDSNKKLRQKKSRAPDLTVMIVAKLGKIRSFKISPRFLTWSLLFFVFYIVISVIIINDYFEKRWTINLLTEQIGTLQHEIEDTRKELYRSKHHLALLESHIYTQKNGIEEEVTPPADTEISEEKTESLTEDSLPRNVAKESPEKLVNVEEMEIQKEKSRLSISFNLVNVQEGDESVNGYVHIIGMNKKADPPQLWTYPKAALRNEMPIEYKSGQLFLIKHFKNIQGEHFCNTKNEFPTSIKVLVYDQSGNILLQKEFEVENVS